MDDAGGAYWSEFEWELSGRTSRRTTPSGVAYACTPEGTDMTRAQLGVAPATLTVSEVARQAGVAASAVRFYESHGLVRAVRSAGNQRRFTADAPCRLKVARLAQRVGLSVKEIAALFDELPDQIGPAEWDAFSQRLIADAEERIRVLREQLAALGSDERLCDLPSV